MSWWRQTRSASDVSVLAPSEKSCRQLMSSAPPAWELAIRASATLTCASVRLAVCGEKGGRGASELCCGTSSFSWAIGLAFLTRSYLVSLLFTEARMVSGRDWFCRRSRSFWRRVEWRSQKLARPDCRIFLVCLCFFAPGVDRRGHSGHGGGMPHPDRHGREAARACGGPLPTGTGEGPPPRPRRRVLICSS